MSATVFVEKEPCARQRLVNTSGADLAVNEFALLGTVQVVAEEAVTSGSSGGFLIGGNGAVFQASTFVTSEGTFATANAPVYWDNTNKKFSDTKKAGYFLVGYVVEILAGSVIRFSAIDTAVEITEKDTIQTGAWFKRTATLTSAAAATAVNLLTAADVGTKTAYVMGAFVKVNGATAWTDTTATIVKVQDTAGTPVVGATVAKAGLTASACLTLGSSSITLGAPISNGTGFTAAKGIDVVADAVFAAGSDLVVTIFGYIE
jgi:hypothetical protein